MDFLRLPGLGTTGGGRDVREIVGEKKEEPLTPCKRGKSGQRHTLRHYSILIILGNHQPGSVGCRGLVLSNTAIVVAVWM